MPLKVGSQDLDQVFEVQDFDEISVENAQEAFYNLVIVLGNRWRVLEFIFLPEAQPRHL